MSIESPHVVESKSYRGAEGQNAEALRHDTERPNWEPILCHIEGCGLLNDLIESFAVGDLFLLLLAAGKVVPVTQIGALHDSYF